VLAVHYDEEWKIVENHGHFDFAVNTSVIGSFVSML